MSHLSARDRLLAGTPLTTRGLVAARAEAAPSASEIKALVEGVNRTFEEFKATHAQQLASKVDDTVLNEKLDKLNAALGEQQRALDDATKRMAALSLGGGGGESLTPEARQHRDTFLAWMRGRQNQEIQARTSTYSDPDGGFLAPPTLDTAVTRILSATLAMRRIAEVMPISTASYIQHKSLGGAGSGWVGETDTGSTGRPETNTPQLARMEFTPGELYAEPYSTQQSLDDMVIDVEAWLAGEVAVTFAEREGAAFISGDGQKKPRGLLTYTIVANASYAWGSVGYVFTGNASSFASSNPADVFLDAIYALKPGYRMNGRWLMSDVVAARVRKFKDGQGNYLWQPAATAGQPATLWGYPVESDDNMPDVGSNAYPVAFGDFRQGYKIVDRTGVRVLRNPYKVNGLVAFYTTKRVGGGIQNFEAIKLIKCATS